MKAQYKIREIMTNNASKRRIWLTATAVIIAVAFVLSCALAAFLYTRTGDNSGAGNIAEGGDGDEIFGLNDRGYGSSIYNGTTPAIPSGAVGYAINSESALSSFLATANANPGTTYYGYLTANFTVGEKPVTNRVLPANATLDGNGYTITSKHGNSNAYNLQKINSAIGSRDSYLSWWGIDTAGGEGNYDVQIYSGVEAYGLSNVISVNYGTIKNLNTVVTRVDGGSGDIQAIYISPWNGNVMMGGIAGINFGVIYNCTMENEIKYGFIPSQYYVNGSNASDRGDISYQEFSAVGGIAGYNGVNPSDSSQAGSIYGCKVVVNDVLGLFRSEIAIRGRWAWDDYIEVPSNSITSGVVGGVAAINNGGIVSGVNLYAEYRETYENYTVLYNTPRHSSKSYTGVITGITNITSSPIVLELNGQNWTFAPSTVTNITLETDYLYIKAEAYDMTDLSRGSYGVMNSAQYPEAGNYAGIVCGQGTTNSNVNFVASYGGDLANAQNVNFRTWNASELNSSQPITSADIPKFGYGTNNSNDYINEIASVSTRFEGQRTENNSTDLTSVGATVSYIWDAEQQSDGSWVSGLRQNINFDNVSGINAGNYFIYGTQSYVNGASSYATGSETYESANVTYGGLAVIPSAASTAVEYDYSLLMQNFADSAAFDAFAGVNAGANFAYAYANALVLNKAHTLDNSSASQRELRSWKTIDGGLNQITVTGVNNNAVNTDGINAVSDFIAVNRGNILNLSLVYQNARGTVTTAGTTALGFVAGVNYGTIAPAVVSTSAVEMNANNADALYALGGAVGYNTGIMSGITVTNAGDLKISGSARQTYLGGVVGVNTGAGVLRTAVVNGNYDVTVQATASSVYGNYVGGFLGAGVNSGSVSTEGNVLTLTAEQSEPFANWLYAGKQRIQPDENSYTGLFAGLISASATYDQTNNPYIKGLVAAAPDLDEAVGWFTPQKGVMSLVGYAAGSVGASGKYVAQDLVQGQIYTVQDASDAFVSKILTGVSWTPESAGNIYRFTVTSLAYSGNWALTPYGAGYQNFVSYGTPVNVGETFSTPWTYSNNNNGSYSYVFDTGLYVQNNDVNSNPDYLAPIIGVKLDYRMNLHSGVSAGDTTNADDALTLFLSGESGGFEHMNPSNGYKALCAGASGAYADNSGTPWTIEGSRAIVFNKVNGLNGGDGMKINVSGSSSAFESVWDEDSQSNVSAEFIAINNSSVSNVILTVDGQRAYSFNDALIYSHLIGVNNGTVDNCSAMLSGLATLTNTGKSVYGAAIGVNNGIYSGGSVVISGAVNLSGGDISYAGGAVGINRGTADGASVNYDGGELSLENNGGTLAVLGGVIGLQDSSALSEIKAKGYGAALSVTGTGAVGGVIGAANAGSNGNTVVSGLIDAAQTTLSNIVNEVYGMRINAAAGYKGLVAATLGEGDIREGALSGIAAHYPDDVESYALPWTTTATDTLAMYGYGTAVQTEGLLFKVSDFSNDGAADFLTERTINVNGADKSFTFLRSQITALDQITLTAKYYYYNSEGALTTDDTYSGAPSLASGIYTTAVNGTYASSDKYVPVLDVLIDYSVIIYDKQNQELVDFMRGDGSGVYAGAHKASLANNASFSVDGTTSSLRAESSEKKILIGSINNTLAVTGTLPTALYNGETVAGGFFAVNRAEIMNLSLTAGEELRASASALGLLAGVNEGKLTNVNATVIGASATVSYFGAVAGINTADVTGAMANLSGTYTVTSADVFAGAAFGSNSGAISGVSVNFDSAALIANPTGIAAAGGVVGVQNGGSVSNTGTAGKIASMKVTAGTGYMGGIVGIINTGAQNTQIAGLDLAPSVMSGIYAGTYTFKAYGGYRGLIAGAVGNIASGSVKGAVAHYYENGYTAGDYKIPWFTDNADTVSMYGYNTADASAEYATGVLFKLSDYSDDGDADFVSERTLVSNANSANWSAPLSYFNGAYDINIRLSYIRYNGDVISTETLSSDSYTASGTLSYTASGDYLNGTGTYVPTLEFFATYSVDIRQGTEYNNYVNEADGIANSMLYCFVDGKGYNQLYAGAKTGYVKENIQIYKPANGYVEMNEGKVLDGGNNMLLMAYPGGYVLQTNDRENDNTASGSGGYIQTEVGGSEKGAVGGLMAVNRGTVRNFNIEIRTTSYILSTYTSNLVDSAAVGMLAGVNYGDISGITFNNSTQTAAITVSGAASTEVVYGGIVGINAESGRVSDLTVNKYSAVNIDGAAKAVYGGLVGENYGEARTLTLNNFSNNTIGQVEEGIYGGAVGSNYALVSGVNVTVGTETKQSDYLSRLGQSPQSRTIYLTAQELAVWGGAVGYNSGTLSAASLLAHINYGMSAGGGDVSAGGLVGINDGGTLKGLKATGWGGFYVYSSAINSTSTTSVFVGGLVGSMNADGAARIGFIDFKNTSSKATISDSVFALSGGMVTMNSRALGLPRYGYVTGALAESYAAVPEGAVSNTFWSIPDKLTGVEGEEAEVLPAFHGGNSQYPTYISAFGKAPSDWIDSQQQAANEAAFAVNSYGFALVDSDDNPINYLTMDAEISGGVLTLNVHKPSGIMFIETPDFSASVGGSGGSGSGTVGAGGAADQTLTVTNAGNTGIGYVTFSFESNVYALTDSAYGAYTQYMVLSFLSTKPCGTVDGSYAGYYQYTMVSSDEGRSLGDAIYRVYQVWSGATEMHIQGTGKTVEITTVPSQPLVLGEGKLFDGGQDSGNKIVVTSAFQNNIAAYTFGNGTDGKEQKYLVVSEFLALNYGTFTNVEIELSGTDGGRDIFRNANDVIANAANMGIDFDSNSLTGFIYGMLVGVNEGVVSQLRNYSFDRIIELDSNAGAKYNSIFGGMVGAQSGADAVIADIDNLTFGTAERAGGITMKGGANMVAAGGVVGIAIDGRIENLAVTLTANSFISVEGAHNAATVGGVVGDLRGVLRKVEFDSEYQSVMKISGTNANGTAALANIAGVINTFEFSENTASIEQVKVIGVGYLYNGIDESGTVTTSSTKLYTAGVVALGSNYSVLTADSADPDVQEIVAAYGEIRPSKLDSVYIDFEGYVRAKANTRVGMIAARFLDGITSETGTDGTETVTKNINYDNIKNLVWQTTYEGDTAWTTSVNYADYTETFSSNKAVAVMGYAPVTVDSSDPDLRGAGMRLWLTNNLYSVEISTADMVTSWTEAGKLSVSITGGLGWQSIEMYLAYYDESGADIASRIKQIKDLGALGAASSAFITVDVATALADIKASAAAFPNGIYVLKTTYNEVYIYDAQQLMTFMSSGTDSTKGLASSDSNYTQYANANIGIIANDLNVDYATQGTGNKSGHYYATAVTMRSDKILEGNGNTVTITTSGNIHSAVLDDKGNTPAGALLEGEYFWDYIGGLNTFTQNDLNQINTDYSIGIRAGGLFLGRNLGTIQNIEFNVPNSITIDNHDYARWFDVITQDSWRNYGTSLFAGIVTAVNAGTIDNCTLTLGENVVVNSLRATCDGPQLQSGYTNNLNYKINTIAVNGGFAGFMYGTDSAQSYISNCTVNLSEGSGIRVESQVSSFSWSGRSDSVYAYAGGIVGWLTDNSTVYNVTINGSGTMTAWGELNMGGKSQGFSSGNKVTSAGSIVGLNSDHYTYTVSSKDNEFGNIDGVICNWNGAAYFLTTGNNNIFYSGTNRVNYYIGAQLAGVAEENTLNNIYFMYGIENYKTFHMDNWYYGSNTATRMANSDFKDKYEYIRTQAYNLLSDPTFPYDTIKVGYSDTADSGGSAVVLASRSNGEVVYNDAFTFEKYSNYNTTSDSSWVSGAPNFSVFGSVGSQGAMSVINDYFPRITRTLDSGGNKDLDYTGARAAAMMTSDGTADWNRLFKPNNVYIYEVAFGNSIDNGTELDMNDPDTSASLTFQTKNITSDVAINITLSSSSMGAQFVWEIYETWRYADNSVTTSSTPYYNNVTSLEQAKQNNNFSRVFDRNNDGADFTFTYVMGMAVKIAMDDSRYYYDETEGVFYDSVAKTYDGAVINDPVLYYADENNNPINRPDLGLGEVSAGLMSPSYYRDSADGESTVKVSKTATDKAGAYRIRITFSSEGGENSKINTTNRTIMFSDFDYIDIYTVVLPKGVTQNNVSVSKTYDGTTAYNESETSFGNNQIRGDVIELSTGVYSQKDAGSGTIFKATYSDFMFRYAVGGEIKEAVIKLFEGTGDTANYAPATASYSGNITLTDGATNFYALPSGNYTYSGTIRQKEISSHDLSLYMWGEEFGIGNMNNRVYDALVDYDTEAFAEKSKILSQTVAYRQSGNRFYLEINGYASGEKVHFYITFTDEEGVTSESVKDKARYKVYINIADSPNFIFTDGNELLESLNIGELLISEYAIQEAQVTYVITAGFLSKIFDNDGKIPFNFDINNLRIVAQGGYEVQPDEYTLNYGALFTAAKGDAGKNPLTAKDAGEYDIYVKISNFTSQNYTLADMTVKFVDESGNQISYFVLPREIKFDSVTKEFDNTLNAEASYTEYTYEKGYEPVSGTNDVFAMKYASLDAGADISVEFTDTGKLTLNGKTYNTLSVVSGANRDKSNYCVSALSARVGNITPVLVTVESVSMIYNNGINVDYRKEGTSVVIKKEKDGSIVNIYPSATFDTKNAGVKKNVRFDTTNTIIDGTTYALLENTRYYTGNLAESGEGFAGNYYVSKTTWNVGEIIKNTLSKADILDNITIVQTNGNVNYSGTAYLFENVGGKKYQYHYGYYVGFEIDDSATVIEGDLLKDHIDVRITNDTNKTNGYVGSYTLELYIKSGDYDWDEDVSDADKKKAFSVTKQELRVGNLEATLSRTEYNYTASGATSINPVLVLTDLDGRRMSSAEGGLNISKSAYTNNNEFFGGNYNSGQHLNVGDYTFTVTPVFVGDDAINYNYSGVKLLEFSVLPANISLVTATKEFDNTTSFTTAGNKAVFTTSGALDPFTPAGTFANKNAGTGKLNLTFETTVINGTEYKLLVDAEDGKPTNNTFTNTRGTITKYTISQAELNTYIMGWVKDMTERQQVMLKGGATLEYRSDADAAYMAEHFLFSVSGMQYGFTGGAASNALTISQGGSTYTMYFTITLSDGTNQYVFAPGDNVSAYMLAAGNYTVSLELSHMNFELDLGAGNGTFVIEKQQISGGDGSGSANVFISLDGDFSYIYGESGFNLPSVADGKFLYTMRIIDKYTGKVSAIYTQADGVIGSIEFTTAADSEEFLTSLDGPLFVGGYFVWASGFAEEILVNYAIPEGARIAVYTAGTPVPEAPDPEEGEQGGEEGGEGEDGVVTIPSLPAEAAYFILPRNLNITSVEKTYDGNTSFAGATLNSDAIASDNVTADLLDGVYESANANYDSTGTTYIEGNKGSDYLLINVKEITVDGIVYYVLSDGGIIGNYCLQGEVQTGVIRVLGAKIKRVNVDASALSLTSGTFEKVYGSEQDAELPEVIANLGSGSEVVVYNADNVIYKQGGEVVENPSQVGGYEMYLTGIAFDNYEVAGLGEILVNADKAATGGDEGSEGGDQGGESGGETGGEEPVETPEVYTYYIVPQEIVISSVVKFYDRTETLVYYGEEEEKISADVTFTDKEGNQITDADGNPVILRVQGRFVDAAVGKGKDVLTDFTPFGYYADFDTAAPVMYYRLLVVGEDGTADVASNYCIAASETVLLPAQFDEDYVPDPELGYDDTPVVNNGLIYNMTLVGAGTVIPAPLTVSDVTKVYDGDYLVDNAVVSGWLEGDEGLVIAKWRYDDKDAATGKIVAIHSDGVAYTYKDTTYYAVYVMSDGEMVLSNYGVQADYAGESEETVVDEEGVETVQKVMYAIIEGLGTITPLELTSGSFSNVNVAGITSNRTEYNSARTYTASEIRATVSALGFTAAAVNANGTLTVTFENGDVITFTATLGGETTAHNAGTYPITLTLKDQGNYTMSAPYTVDFIITRQSINRVYVVMNALEKEYDGTGVLPAYSTDGWSVYAIDKQGNAIDMSSFGAIDLSALGIVFKRYNEEEQKEEYFVPVNVTDDPGYQIYVNGIALDGENYVFTAQEDAFGVVSFDETELTYETAYYKIAPRPINISSDAFESKKFNGAYSLRINGGIDGETVIVGDGSGLNASLAGTYGTLDIKPFVSGVAVSADALNQDSVAANYVLYYEGAPVTENTVITVTDYTVTQADVLVAERENGSYAVGISGLQGLDFLFAKTADITTEAQQRIIQKLMSGEIWSESSFDSSSDFAKLNQAVLTVFAMYVNNADSAAEISLDGRYLFTDFAYTTQSGEYVLTFKFTGLDGHDNATATDRYTFVVQGNTESVKSTNHSTTSSELESGQLNAAQTGAGIAVSTEEELKEAIKNNSNFYLVNSIYGADLSDVSDTVFTGTFDGRGYTLSLAGGAAETATNGAAGMLVAVNNGTISNLTVKVMPENALSAASAGGLVGINNGVVSNVSVEFISDIEISGASNAGGIAGVNGADGRIEDSGFVYSANVKASGATWGAIAGSNAGALTKVAIRVNESAGCGDYSVSAAGAGYVAGASEGSADGVIVAIAAGRVTGVSALFASGATLAQNVYSYVETDGAAGGQLSLLEPYTNGYIGYYFATADDYTTGGIQHNVFTEAGEYNKSYYADYSDGAGYIAVEAIAPYNRFIWDGYGINYRTAAGTGNIGSALNRIVALFAAGDIAAQFEGTAVITSGVNAFTVAIGVRGGTVDVEGDVETSIKEVVYTGVAQTYTVKITVTTGGVSETRELSVGGTEAGYYSKASIEGIIGGGSGETIGDVTYDSGSRTEYTFSGEGAKVANGIALVIYPKQVDADGVTATKYYDTQSAGMLRVEADGKEAGYVDGNYYDGAGAITSQVAAAEKFGFASFGALTRSVLSKDGVLYGIVSKTGEDGKEVYETQPIKVGNDENAVEFTSGATVGQFDVRDLMIAMSRLVDEDYAREVLTAEQLEGFTFIKVYNLSANVTSDQENTATVSGAIVYRPVLGGENGDNYTLYSAGWSAPSDMTIGADEATFALKENAIAVSGAIRPVDLGVYADYVVGKDQSYNSAMLDPVAEAGRTVSVTQAEAEAMGISAENYDRLVAEVAAGLTVSFAENFYDKLVSDGVLEKRADGKYYTTAEYSRYCTAELPTLLDGGNFVLTAQDNTVTFRYFGTALKDGAAFYTLTSADDYYKWIDNEGGTGDYNAIDMLLTQDIDFGGKVTDMLAWRDAEGNVQGYKGTFDGDGKALVNMLIERSGSAALFERIDEGATVRNLTVADAVIIASGENSVAGGIAVDNYGSIENCAFEGILSAAAKTGGIAAVNYGAITGGASINRAYVDEGGIAEGISENAESEGVSGTSDGVSITESAVIGADGAEENTVIENADGTAAEWNEESLVPVIKAYVFDERYVKVDGNGLFITDNFFKLNAVDKLFGWVGADAVTAATQNGFYGSLTLK